MFGFAKHPKESGGKREIIAVVDVDAWGCSKMIVCECPVFLDRKE